MSFVQSQTLCKVASELLLSNYSAFGMSFVFVENRFLISFPDYHPDQFQSCPGNSAQKVDVQSCDTFRDTEIELMLKSSETGKESKENGVISRSATPIPSRPTTPKPLNGSDQFRSGMLTIRIFSGLYFYVAHPLSFLVRFRKRIVPHSRSAGSRSHSTGT